MKNNYSDMITKSKRLKSIGFTMMSVKRFINLIEGSSLVGVYKGEGQYEGADYYARVKLPRQDSLPYLGLNVTHVIVMDSDSVKVISKSGNCRYVEFKDELDYIRSVVALNHGCNHYKSMRESKFLSNK